MKPLRICRPRQRPSTAGSARRRRPATRTPAGGAVWKMPRPAQRDREDVGLALQPRRRARHRLQAGALGERADPRRALAVEREQVLPREPAGALGGQRQRLVEQRAGAGVVALAAAPVAVELAERPEPLDLQAVAGIELADELGAGEADARAGGQQRLRSSSTRRCAAASGTARGSRDGVELAARGHVRRGRG